MRLRWAGWWWAASTSPTATWREVQKFDYKLEWLDRLIDYGRTLLDTGMPGVLCGVYNAVPTPIGAVMPRRWTTDAVHFLGSGNAYSRLLRGGWIDAIRTIHSGKGIFTYWNLSFRDHCDRNSGLRMDDIPLSQNLSDLLRHAGVDADLRGGERPSDHALVWIEHDHNVEPAP